MRHILALLFCLTFVNAAPITIVPVEIGADPGYSGKVEASFNTNKGNVDSDAYSTGARLQYDSNYDYVVWGEASINYAEASSVKNADDTYLHVRYIHKLDYQKNINWETYVQSETNEFTKIQERLLVGGNLRFHILQERIGNIFFGMGAFYEHIDYSSLIAGAENNMRDNLYLLYTKQLKEKNTISYAVYYQPKANNTNDYLLANSLELEILVYQKLYLTMKVSYNVDSNPIPTVKVDDFTQKTSLLYKF